VGARAGDRDVKRWVFTIVLFLLLGAVATVAIAWTVTCLPYSPSSKVRDEPPFGLFLTFNADVPITRTRCSYHAEYRLKPSFTLRRPCPYVLSGDELDLVAPSWSIVHDRERLYEMAPPRLQRSWIASIQEQAAGWPCLALRGTHYFDPSTGNDNKTAQHRFAYRRSCIFLPTWLRPDETLYSLPIEPIFPGFLINAVLYAIVLWMLLCGPFALRRLIRRKRGCCPKCGYDLRGELGGGCSECGWRREVAGTG